MRFSTTSLILTCVSALAVNATPTTASNGVQALAERSVSASADDFAIPVEEDDEDFDIAPELDTRSPKKKKKARSVAPDNFGIPAEEDNEDFEIKPELDSRSPINKAAGDDDEDEDDEDEDDEDSLTGTLEDILNLAGTKN